MTNTTIAPKKSGLKKILAIISAVLLITLGTNHLSFQFGYAEIGLTVNDSTAAVTVTAVDSLPVTDTLKLDTLNK